LLSALTTMLLHQYYISIQILIISKKLFTILPILYWLLFVIRYRINQAVQISEASHIIIITDSIHLAKHISNLITHPYQIQLIAIAQDFKAFFNKNT